MMKLDCRNVGRALPTVVLVLAVAAIGPMAAVSSAGDTSMDFHATDDFLFNPSVPPDALFAAIQCVHGESTGNPVQPCSPGSRMHIRGVVAQSTITSTDPRFAGTETVTVNANLDVEYAGPAWGRWSLAVEGDAGWWEGGWHGTRTRIAGGSPLGGDAWVTHIELDGFGFGALEGLRVDASEQIVTFTPLPLPYEALGFCIPAACPAEGAITGRIVESSGSDARPRPR
jgi:hypothetical protein